MNRKTYENTNLAVLLAMMGNNCSMANNKVRKPQKYNIPHLQFVYRNVSCSSYRGSNKIFIISYATKKKAQNIEQKVTFEFQIYLK